MSTNANNVVPINGKKLTAAEKAKATAVAMSGVESAAFNAGESRACLIERVRVTCGPRPALALFEQAGLAIVIGYMASALARKGDNRPEKVLLAHCRDRILNYQGAGGTGKLRKGQKGRRTQTEEDAYTSARQLKMRIMRDANVATPKGKSGGHNAGKPSPNKGKVKAGKVQKEAVNDKPAVRAYKDADAIVAYALAQANAMLLNINKNAKIAPSWLKSAVQDFNAAVKKGAGQTDA